MNGVAIGLGLFVTLAVVAYTAWPWLARRRDLAESGAQVQLAQSTQGEKLAEQREELLTALRDLEFDYTVGKVLEEDYGPLRQSLLAKVADIMVQLDEVQAESDLDVRIEAEILAARRVLHLEHNQVVATHLPTSNTLSVSSALPLSNTLPLSSTTCPACGWMRRPDALYCVKCGTKLPSACPECGEMVQTTDQFCADCGTELALALA